MYNVSVNSNANIPDVSNMDKNEPVMYAKYMYSYMKWRTILVKINQYNNRLKSRCKTKISYNTL